MSDTRLTCENPLKRHLMTPLVTPGVSGRVSGVSPRCHALTWGCDTFRHLCDTSRCTRCRQREHHPEGVPAASGTRVAGHGPGTHGMIAASRRSSR